MTGKSRPQLAKPHGRHGYFKRSPSKEIQCAPANGVTVGQNSEAQGACTTSVSMQATLTPVLLATRFNSHSMQTGNGEESRFLVETERMTGGLRDAYLGSRYVRNSKGVPHHRVIPAPHSSILQKANEASIKETMRRPNHMDIWPCICTYMFVYSCVSRSTALRAYTQPRLRVHADTRTHMHACTHARMQARLHARTHTHTHTQTYTWPHARTRRTHIQVHTHVRTESARVGEKEGRERM